MKKLLLFLGLFLYTLISNAADCSTRGYVMTEWTGDCLNGKIQGVGSGKANYYAQNYSLGVFGKFKIINNSSYKTGFYLEDWEPGQSKKIKVYRTHDSRTVPDDVSEEVLSAICVEGCKSYITKNSVWASNGNRNQVLDTTESNLTLDRLLSHVYANMQKLGIVSVDPATFKTYLLSGEVKSALAEKQRMLDIADDPPVVGVRLSLSDASGNSNKPKKKSKKKQNN